MGLHGRWHLLVVRKVGEAGEYPLLDDFADYEIIHPDCPLIAAYESNGLAWSEYDCAVGYEETNGGHVRGNLGYSGTPVTEPGCYLISAWHETIRGFDYTEHDGGLVAVSADA